MKKCSTILTAVNSTMDRYC